MSSKLLIAKVMLPEPVLPDETAIQGALARLRPEMGELRAVRREDGSLVLNVEGDTGAVSLLPEPMAIGELGAACAAAWYWPEAAQRLGSQKAQILAGVLPEAADLVGAAIRLTALAAAVSEAAGGEAVYWAAAGLIHAPDAFATYTKEMSRLLLPLYLWIDFHVHPDAEGTVSLYTRGLAAFQSLEIEVYGSRKSPQELVGRVYDIVHYVLTKNAVLHEGETIGRTNEERISVHIGPSRRDLEARAIQLEI